MYVDCAPAAHETILVLAYIGYIDIIPIQKPYIFQGLNTKKRQ